MHSKCWFSPPTISNNLGSSYLVVRFNTAWDWLVYWPADTLEEALAKLSTVNKERHCWFSIYEYSGYSTTYNKI